MCKKKKTFPAYTFKRNSLLYFRYSLPASVHSLIGKKELRYSLRTGYRRCAQGRATKLRERVDLFVNYLKESPTMQELSEKQIQSLLDRYLKDAMEGEEDSRVLADRPRTPDQIEGHLETLSFLLFDAGDDLRSCDYRRVKKDVDRLLQENGLPPITDPDTHKKLCRELLKTQIQFYKIEEERTRGIYADTTTQLPASTTQSVPPVESNPISELIPMFVDEFMASGRWTEKTKNENQAVYQLFIDIAGDLPIQTIDYKTIQNYKATLRKLPANRNKSIEYRGKTIDQILEMQNVQPMAINSVNKNIRRLGQLFKWANKIGYIDRNPVEGSELPAPKRVDQYRDPFTKGDLLALFSNPVFTERKFSRSYMFWVPLLGLFTGARIEEICSLYLEDFQEAQGVPVISVNKNHPDKKLKTKSSERLIPIHPELIALGLLDHVSKLIKKKETRLFPELQHARDGFGSGPSKWFGKFRKKCGVTSDKKVFHSFRHTFANTLKQADIPRDQAAELLGHDTGKDVTYGRYGKPSEAQRALEVVKTLDFGIDFRSLLGCK